MSQHALPFLLLLLLSPKSVSWLQAEMLHVVEALASKQDTVMSRLDRLTDQLQQLLTKQASTMLL